MRDASRSSISRNTGVRLILFLPLLPLVAAVLAYAFCPKPPLLDGVPFSTAWYDKDGTLLRLDLADDQAFRLYAPLHDMDPALIAATLAQEDRHFYRHPGVNPFALVRSAFETYIRRSRAMGGSTITMQVVRMRDHLDTRRPGGKIVQILKALQLERHYSKDDILEAYLNLAPYGGNIEGAEAAARIYYHRSAKTLAVPQGIGLAVIPQNPVRRFPLRGDMREWDDARLRLFRAMPDPYKRYDSDMRLPQSVWGRDDLPFLAPHFLNGLGKRREGRVTTTLDLSLQTLVETRIKGWLARERARGIDNAAAMLVHVPDMEVRALAGSGDFFNAALDGQVDGTAAARSPGSALKPFIYALALDQGLIHPETLLADDPESFAAYRPANFDHRFIGMIPAREALVLSRNIPAIALAARLQNPALYDFLQQAGAGFPKPATHYGLSIAVGGAEVSMRTLVRLYAMLAEGGVLRDLTFTRDQELRRPRNLLSPEAAFLTLAMLERQNPDTPPFAQGTTLPVYWKTGTSSGFRDAWTIGVFGPYVLAVWTGHFDGRSSPALIGAQAAAPLFFDLEEAIAARERLRDRIHPAMDKLNLARVSICRQTGTPTACASESAGWFIPGKSPFAPERTGPARLEILSPRSGFSYVSRDAGDPVPLEAKNLEDGLNSYWFDNNRLIAVAHGAEARFWTPSPGRHTIRVVDSRGRSAVRHVSVVAAR